MNGWIILLIVVALVGMLAKVGFAGSGSAPETAKEKIRQGALVLDVRTPAEFQDGHYKGATNIPLQVLASRLGELGAKDKAVVVYCRSGNRSAQAARILKDAGFKDVTNAGGLSNMPRPEPR